MNYVMAHLNGLVVDLIFIVMAFYCFRKNRSMASLVALFFFFLTTFCAHAGLAFVKYHYAFNVDFHLLMAIFMMAFFVVLMKMTVGYGLLKLAVGLNVLLHAVMILKEPAQQMYLISPKLYTVLYDSYPNARIVIVSLQILGLKNGSKYGGNSDFGNRFYSRLSCIIDRLRVLAIGLLRVKNP